MNKLYLIQPQASQINVRHVGSSTYGNYDHLLRSEVFRKLTNFTDGKIHAKVCYYYYYTEQWGGALRDDTNNGFVADKFLTGLRAFLLEAARSKEKRLYSQASS